MALGKFYISIGVEDYENTGLGMVVRPSGVAE